MNHSDRQFEQNSKSIQPDPAGYQQPNRNIQGSEYQSYENGYGQAPYIPPYAPSYYYQQQMQWQNGYANPYQQYSSPQMYTTQNTQAYYHYNTQETPKKKGRTLTVLAIIAGSLACLIVVSLFFIGVLIPMLKEKLESDYPYAWQDWNEELAEPIIKEDDYPPDSSITSIGGSAPVIENTINPVPEIAEQLSQSIVGIDAYMLEDGEPSLYSRGTGFVIHENGYILTNYHVVVEGDTYTVSVEGDDTLYEAKYVGGDATTDLAVLKVDGLNLKPVALGSSENTKVGEMAIAVGNPAGANANLTGSVTVGYISYVGRKLSYNGSQQEFLQIDAAINPGNSGGPLLNSKGEAIGVITLKSLISSYDEYGYPINSEGLGFAIPIDTAKEIALEIIRNGSLKRPGIGILYLELTAEEAAEQNVVQGKQIQDFMANSPAEAAGLELGDIIIKCNDVLLSEQDILVQTIQSLQLGDTIKLTVWREGQELDFIVTIADMNHMVVY